MFYCFSKRFKITDYGRRSAQKNQTAFIYCDGNQFYHRIGTQCVSAVGRDCAISSDVDDYDANFLADISTDFNWHGIGVSSWFVC
jgi:hypothetical protein